jgi:2-amino-4-hydroxy-6-hydroxymethyldihydropteridine diphosphokinase
VSTAAILALGSNLGDREATIREAVRDIAALPGVVVTAASGLVETPALKPHGVDTDAPAYLNAIVRVDTLLEPHDLLTALTGIEAAHGRVREERWGDRTLDLDIVTFGALTINSPGLTIPHPRAGVRDFVLGPWLQVEPEAELPGLGPIAALITRMPDDYPAEPLL